MQDWSEAYMVFRKLVWAMAISPGLFVPGSKWSHAWPRDNANSALSKSLIKSTSASSNWSFLLSSTSLWAQSQ